MNSAKRAKSTLLDHYATSDEDRIDSEELKVRQLRKQTENALMNKYFKTKLSRKQQMHKKLTGSFYNVK